MAIQKIRRSEAPDRDLCHVLPVWSGVPLSPVPLSLHLALHSIPSTVEADYT